MSWTKISKPNSQTYVNVNTKGKEQYDDVNILYDDSNVFYDGVNPAQWTNVAKPTLGLGLFTWAQMIIAWSEANATWGSVGAAWTNVAKPT